VRAVARGRVPKGHHVDAGDEEHAPISSKKTAAKLMAARLHYVCTPGTSLGELAKRYHVERTHLLNVAASEGWLAERERYVRQLINEAQTQAAAAVAATAVVSFCEILEQIAGVRRAALGALRKKLETPDELEVIEDQVESETANEETGERIKRIAKRKRVAVDTSFIWDLIEREFQALSAIVGINVAGMNGVGTGAATMGTVSPATPAEVVTIE